MGIRAEDALAISVSAGLLMAAAPWLALLVVRRSARRRYSRAIDARIASGRADVARAGTTGGPSVLRGAVAPGVLLGAALLVIALLPTALSPRAGDAYASRAAALVALDACSCLAAGVLIVASARGWRALPARDERLAELHGLAGEQERSRRDAAAERANRRTRGNRVSIERAREMTGSEFERLCARYFESLGYTVDLTPQSGDGGVDLVLTRDGELLLVQCKQTRKPVGEPVVRDLYGAVNHAVAAGGVVCASNGFTAAAATWAAGKRISLVDGDEIVATLRRGPGQRRGRGAARL